MTQPWRWYVSDGEAARMCETQRRIPLLATELAAVLLRNQRAKTLDDTP